MFVFVCACAHIYCLCAACVIFDLLSCSNPSVELSKELKDHIKLCTESSLLPKKLVETMYSILRTISVDE
jgi:hypothetical protein